MRTYSFFILLLLALFAVQPEAAHAQFTKRLKERAKQHTENKAIDEVIEKEDKALDKALGDGALPAPVAQPQANGATVGETNADVATTSVAAETLKPGEGIWANYDFVPGERPLFVDDFSTEKVGNFPAAWSFRRATWRS
ncbi:MAG TPA: hypothetical protein VKP65_15000 [Rhodothermales bacterium]|nr:hypothetical protein [Rhodothermales bacterium]